MSKNHMKRHSRIGQAIKANRSPGWWSNSANRLRSRMHRHLKRASRRALKRDGQQQIRDAIEESEA